MEKKKKIVKKKPKSHVIKRPKDNRPSHLQEPFPFPPPGMVEVRSLQDIQNLLGGKGRPECPDIMLATHACVCISCSRKGKCAFEKMSCGAGCVHSFPVYCSLRAQEQKELNKDSWPDVAMRDWINGLRKKYDIPELTDKIVLDKADPSLVKMEETNGTKEGKGDKRVAGHSDGTEEHIHNGVSGSSG